MPALPRPFQRLAWSNLAAQSAEQIGLAAAPIVAVLSFGSGPGETGWLQTAQTLPFLLFAIPAGIVVDRMPRPRLMALAEALRALSLVATLVLALAGVLDLASLAVLGFVGACGTVIYSVAAPALVPALVPAQDLAVANSRIELARTVAFAAGPALGGALVSGTGAAPAFGVAAALSIMAAWFLVGLKEPARVPPPRRHPVRELRDGLVFVFAHPLLRPVFATQFIFGLAFFILLAVYPPYAIHHLGLSPTELGLTLAAYGIGMVAGALAAPGLMRSLRFGTVVAIGPVAGFVAAGLMTLTIWLPWGWLAGSSFLLMGAGPILWVISTTTLRQSVTPPELLGRASAVNIAAYGARPLGAAIGATIGGLYGAPTCLVVAAAAFLVQALLILRSPVPCLDLRPAPLGSPDASVALGAERLRAPARARS